MDTNQFKVDVPEGQSGDWTIKRITITEEASKFDILRSIVTNHMDRSVPAGTFTQLLHARRGIIMSDTPAEIRDHLEVIRKAKGQVLINGLGLGVVARACLQKEEVQSVTVIEISEDVIKLVSPWLTEVARVNGKTLTIVNADAMSWKSPKGQRYDVVWHDLWDNICGDNLPDMHKFHRRYGRICDWQASWARELVEQHERVEKRQLRRWGTL